MPESLETVFSPSNYLSELISRRQESEFTVDSDELKHVVPHPAPIDISYGDPNYEFFPIHSLEVSTKLLPFDAKASGSHSIERLMADESKLELKKAMNYYWTSGHKSLLEFTKEFIQEVYPPGYSNWDLILTTGSANGLHKIFETVVCKGDTVLVEEFSYPAIFPVIKEVGATGVPIKLSATGIDYEYLAQLLDNWDLKYPGIPKPKCLYTIPTGQNPTGSTQSPELRQKIYNLAEAHDFLIIEDDPYGYITLPPYLESRSDTSAILTKKEYLATLATSYVSLDTKGRVLRVETFSKVFAPGIRLGFILAHKDFIKQLVVLSGVITGAPAGISQAVLVNTIVHLGGIDGWISWLIKLRAKYVERRDVMLEALYSSAAYKNKQIEVIDPEAGMFVVVTVNLDKRPPTEYKSLMNQLTKISADNGVEVRTGVTILFDTEFSASRINFVRLTFASLATNEDLIEASNRFTKSVSELFETL